MDKAFDWKEGEDMSLRLDHGELQAKWQEHYAKLPEIHFQDTGCSRCGASVHALARDRHVMWHKNVTFQMWLVSEWARVMVNPFIGKSAAVFEELGEMLTKWADASDG